MLKHLRINFDLEIVIRYMIMESNEEKTKRERTIFENVEDFVYLSVPIEDNGHAV